jgi:hypothetical protein
LEIVTVWSETEIGDHRLMPPVVLLETVVALMVGLPVPEAIKPQGLEEKVELLSVGEPPAMLMPE